MWNFLTDFGGTTVTLDVTNNLFGLLSGLIGILWFSAGLLVCVTIRHCVSRRTMYVDKISPAFVDFQEAA